MQVAAITYTDPNAGEIGNNIVTVPQLYGEAPIPCFYADSLGISAFARDDSQPSLAALIDGKTSAVFCESIGNPATVIIDLKAMATMAHAKGVPLIVDNTVATPILCKPIEFGADIVVHSLTKYMGGHGNSLGGLGQTPAISLAEHADRYPMLNQPEPAYHGVVYTEAMGPAAFIARARTVPTAKHGQPCHP